MDNKIIVRKYTDLKPFFEQKLSQRQISVNTLFIKQFDKTSKLLSNVGDVDNEIKASTTKFANTTNFINQAKGDSNQLQAIITPKMEEALSNGSAILCDSHKDGQIFSKIQYKDGSSEFISLEKVKGMPNYADIAILANQMQILQTVIFIQNTLTDFAEEAGRQLLCLQRDNHDNRMIKVETAKLDFEEFLKGNPRDYKYIMHSINEAFPSISQEIKSNLGDLDEICEKIDKKKTSLGMKKMMEKEQVLINYVLDDLTHLQDLCCIEMYVEYIRDENKTVQENGNSIISVQKKYSDLLIDNFTQEKLELLSGLSNLPEDIWHNNFMPGIQNLKTNMEEILICQNNVQGNTMAMV